MKRAIAPALAAVLAAIALLAAFATARPLVFHLGTSEASYLRGFQFTEGIGDVPRWAKAQAEIALPVILAGKARLSIVGARPERPPAEIVLRQGEREVMRFAAGEQDATASGELAAGGVSSLTIEAASEPRYGLLVKALRVEPLAPFALLPSPGLLLRVALAAAVLAIAFTAAGFSWQFALALSMGLLALPLALVAACDPLAALHLAKRGVLVDASLVALVVPLARRWFGARAPYCVLIAALAIGLRCALVFHPRYDYQDVVIHQRMARAIAHDGAAAVWSDIAHYQQRLDLGRASVGGRFRPLPYPPTFHTLVAWAPALAQVDVMKAAAVLCGGLGVLLTMLIARRLDASGPLLLVTGVLAALFPDDVLELLRASYPALLGHVADIALVGCLLLRPESLRSWRGAFLLGCALAACALTYNASPVHFALFLPLLWLAAARPPAISGRRGLVVMASVGALFSLSFYGAYLWDTATKLIASSEATPAASHAEGLSAYWGLPSPFVAIALIGLALLIPHCLEAWHGRLLLAWTLYLPAIALVVALFPEPFFYFRRFYFAHSLLLVACAWALTRRRLPGVLSAAVLLVWCVVTLSTYVDPFFVTHTGSLAAQP